MKISNLSMFLESSILDEKTGEVKSFPVVELEHEWQTLEDYYKDKLSSLSPKESLEKIDNGAIISDIESVNNKRNIHKVYFK